MKSEVLKLLDVVAQTIYDKKGMNVLVLDVQGISTITDYFLIAEGRVDRHVSALGDAITDALDERGQRPLHVDGKGSGGWIVLDYQLFIVHLFLPEWREKYRLEQLWRDGKIVDVNIKI